MSKRAKQKKKRTAPPPPKGLDQAETAQRIDAVLKESYDRLQRGQSAKAEDVLRKGIRAHGRDPKMLANLVMALESQNKTDEAFRVAQAAVEVAPDDARSHNNLGAMHKFRGDFESATTHFRRAVELEPDHADAWRNLAGLQEYTTADHPDLAAIRSLLERLPRNHEGRAALYFALGRAHDQIGDADEAFDHWDRGNRAQRGRARFSVDDMARFVRETIDVQTEELVSRGPARGASDAAPILIVGMPRSGSTLIEQVLASHPDVEGVGEVPDLPRAIDPHVGDPRYRMQALAGLDDDALASIGESYARSLERRAPGAGRIVDKYLTNFVHVGTLHRALPEARFIHSNRAPMACGFACYKTLFTSNVPFAYDLQEIGTTLGLIDEIMDHWRAVTPDAVLTVDYESMVSDLEGETRRILEFVGLPWNDACLRFHETERRVNSASATQVRQPLYTSALDAWKRYEHRLAPLAEALGSRK